MPGLRLLGAQFEKYFEGHGKYKGTVIKFTEVNLVCVCVYLNVRNVSEILCGGWVLVLESSNDGSSRGLPLLSFNALEFACLDALA